MHKQNINFMKNKRLHGKTTIGIDAGVAEKARRAALKEGRSLGKQVERWIMDAIEKPQTTQDHGVQV